MKKNVFVFIICFRAFWAFFKNLLRGCPIVPTCDNRVAGFSAAFSAGVRAGFYFLHNCACAAPFIVTSRTCLCSYTGDKFSQDFWQDLPHQFSYFSRKIIQEGRLTKSKKSNRIWLKFNCNFDIIFDPRVMHQNIRTRIFLHKMVYCTKIKTNYN